MEKLYPAGPATVPDDLARPTSAYKRQAWLAGAGLTAFVVLYAALAAWFSWTAFRLLREAVTHTDALLLSGLAGLCSAFLALFMLKALVFVKRGSTGRDPEITANQEPALFAFLYRLADETGAPCPHRVFLSGEVNAAVFYDLSVLNLVFPSRKNLVIGLPLINVLTLSELKAVLAHEFGHFAQRSMAIGIWVYIAHQIASHVIAHRDALDKFLSSLSRFDLRVAWIGWLLRLVVWSIRSLLDTVLRLMLLAQRALSREMEFQADLVSVSVTGSDALVHALYKLRAADEAWDRARNIALNESYGGRVVRNVFELQTRAIEKVGAILGDKHYGRVPPLPARDAENHRVFKVGLAQPPRMWSTHPESSDREKNAKKRYIAVPLDERSAWELFGNPGALRADFCAKWFPPRMDPNAAPTKPEEADLDAALERQLGRTYLQPDFRGAYLGRTPVRNAAKVAELYGGLPDAAGLAKALDGLYPAALAEQFTRLRQLEEEKIGLHGLWKGTMSAPDGVVKHRGEEVSRRELPDLIAQVDKEADALRDQILEHDRRCRSVHLAAAKQLAQGWPQYLQGLLAVLHYADHNEANLRDAQGALGNVYAVVTADGKVSNSERKRLIAACNELHTALASVHSQATLVTLDPALRERLGIENWKAALGEFSLVPASDGNIGQWLGVIDGWVNSAAGGLSAIKLAALEQLLVSEAQVARAVREGGSIDAAPMPSHVPSEYPVLLPGSERTRQTKLGWWDRFQTADGWAPATARVAVALVIVLGVVAFGGAVGQVDLQVYNGLGRSVVVSVDGQTIEVGPNAHIRVEVERGEHRVATRTSDGELIESFPASIDDRPGDWVYNVAGASPLVQWVAVYGDRATVPPVHLGLARWQPVEADIYFEEPPASIKSKNDNGGTRTVLSGVGTASPNEVLDIIPESQRLEFALLQARWVSSESRHAPAWMAVVSESGQFPDLIKARLAANPADKLALRFQPH